MAGKASFEIDCDECGGDITEDETFCRKCSEHFFMKNQELLLKVIEVLEKKPLKEVEEFFGISMTEAMRLRNTH